MRILITGATGFIGSHLCETLAERGHQVVALSRRPDAARERLPVLDDAHVWTSPTDEPPPSAAFDGVDAVAHLAGESVAGRWTSAKKRAIRDSRVQGTRHLVETMEGLERRPDVLVSVSAVGVYGDRGDEELTEDADLGTDFLARVCADWEAESRRAEDLNVRVVNPRIGLALGPGGGALAPMLPLFKFGLGGPLGSGRQWWPWVHLDDVVGIIRHALEHDDLQGPANATAPAPVRQRDFARGLGRVVNRPAFLPAPAFALRLVLGEFSKELLDSRRVRPKRADASGYAFEHTQLEPALRNVLQGRP